VNEIKYVEPAPEDLEDNDKSVEYSQCLLNISKINALERVRGIRNNE